MIIAIQFYLNFQCTPGDKNRRFFHQPILFIGALHSNTRLALSKVKVDYTFDILFQSNIVDMGKVRRLKSRITKRHTRRIVEQQTAIDLESISGMQYPLFHGETESDSSENFHSFQNNELLPNNIDEVVTNNVEIFPSNSNSSISDCSRSVRTPSTIDLVPDIASNNNYVIADSENSYSDDYDRNVDLKNQLVAWAFEYNVPHNACNGILSIFREFTKFELPKDIRTLLKTPRKADINSIGGGSYYHFGLNGIIEKMLNELKDIKKIDLLLNVDGLPLSRSSTASFWPILCSNTKSKKVYIVGAFYGYRKPDNCNEFLGPITHELEILSNVGYMKNGKQVQICLHALICDAPAKSFVLSVKCHTGFYSCTKCTIKGVYKNGRVCFPVDISNLQLRKDEAFKKNVYEDYQVGDSILNSVNGFGPVTNVPLDYMHLLCLGVVKKLILLWLQGPLQVRLSAQQVDSISKLLLSLKNTTPNEFARRPRSLKDVRQWKATEFRSFLLYTGPLVLKNILKQDIFLHFITLHIAITILVSASLCQSNDNLKYAEALLAHFVTSFGTLYGEQYISHNVHNLLHLCNDVRKFGPLDAFSAYRFENFMSSIKKLLRKSEKPLEQLVRRYYEIECTEIPEKKIPFESELFLGSQHSSGPLDNLFDIYDSQYGMMTFQNFTFKCKRGSDNWCLLKNGSCIIIKNILKGKDNIIYIIGKKLKKMGSFYRLPCDSEHLDIMIVGDLEKSRRFHWPITDIKCKVWAMPYKKKYVVFPLVHTN